jgi:DNA-directed RNA polymerase subunit RPC12/RpoP
MNLVTLKTTETSVEAHIIRSKLESEGIACYIFDENMVTMNALYNNAVKGIKIKVNDFDVELAQQVLDTVQNTPLLDEQGRTIKCPNCESTQLYSGYNSSRNAKGFISLLLSILLMIFPFYLDKVYKCKNCGKEFKTEKE